jgi:hypothetical protein
MAGGGKGGKQTTEVKIPEWLEGAARTNMARADEIAKIGSVPLYGPDVADFSSLQRAAFQNTNQAAQAFGQVAPQDPLAGIPQAQTYAGGIQGFSSGSLYDQALAELQRRNPAQFAALQAPFINPQTGAPPAAPFGAPAPKPAAPVRPVRQFEGP